MSAETYRGTSLSCPTCRETYVALGATEDAEQTAALAGPTCCTPKTPQAPSNGRGTTAPADPSSGAAGSCAPHGVGAPAQSSDGSAPDVRPAALGAAGGWRHTAQGLALYVGVPCVWLGFLAALVLGGVR